MAFQYAKLGLAALLAAPAILAAPLPQAAVTKTVMVCVDQNGHTLACPDSAAPAQTSAAAASSSAAPVVQAQAVKPSSSAAAASSTKAAASSAQSPAPSSSAAANPSGGSSTGGKMGLVYTKIDVAQATQIAQSSGGKISWMYDWEGTTSTTGQSGYELGGVEYVPMLHDPSLAPQWEGTVQYAPGPQGTNALHALFYNEPDNNGISASSAASDFQNIFAKHVGSGTRLGGPAVMQGSTSYLSQFNQACSSCKIDFNVMHYYGEDDSIDSFSSAVTAMYKAGGNKPLWVTEFGLKAVRDGGSFSEQQRGAFIAAAAKWMDGQNIVERYSPYMVGSSGDDSMTPGGTITNAYLSS